MIWTIKFQNESAREKSFNFAASIDHCFFIAWISLCGLLTHVTGGNIFLRLIWQVPYSRIHEYFLATIFGEIASVRLNFNLQLKAWHFGHYLSSWKNFPRRRSEMPLADLIHCTGCMAKSLLLETLYKDESLMFSGLQSSPEVGGKLSDDTQTWSWSKMVQDAQEMLYTTCQCFSSLRWSLKLKITGRSKIWYLTHHGPENSQGGECPLSQETKITGIPSNSQISIVFRMPPLQVASFCAFWHQNG